VSLGGHHARADGRICPRAAALGNLAAFYYYSYVAMQIPAGVLADRWGPRRVLTAGAAVAAAGTLLFALAPGYAAAGIGRLMIGGSVGVASSPCSSSPALVRAYALCHALRPRPGLRHTRAVSAGVPLRLLVDAFAGA